MDQKPPRKAMFTPSWYGTEDCGDYKAPKKPEPRRPGVRIDWEPLDKLDAKATAGVGYILFFILVISVATGLVIWMAVPLFWIPIIAFALVMPPLFDFSKKD